MEEKERKRVKLLNWMKERQQTEKRKYLETLDEKRATEFHPFNGGQVSPPLIDMFSCELVVNISTDMSVYLQCLHHPTF